MSTTTPSEIKATTPNAPPNIIAKNVDPIFGRMTFDHFRTTSGIILLSQSFIGFILTVISAIYVRNSWPFFTLYYYVLSVYNIFWIANIFIIISCIINVNWHKLINNELLNAIKTIYTISAKYVS